jgi:small subunit ribosomal protein S7
MRTKRAQIREAKPDHTYGSSKVTKLINYVMRDGKKSVAQSQVYAALALLETQTKRKPLEIFEEVLEAITPQMEVRSRRIGGAAYQVPMPVSPRRGTALALRWLVQEANKRPSSQYHTFAEKLVAEMLDALENQGGAINKKLASHRMADANKAFAHFRW